MYFKWTGPGGPGGEVRRGPGRKELCGSAQEACDGGAGLLQGSRRLFDHFAVGVLAVGEGGVLDGLAQVFVGGGAVGGGQAADAAAFKTVERSDLRECGQPGEHPALLDDAVVVDPEHDDRAGAETAGLAAEGDLALAAESDEFI